MLEDSASYGLLGRMPSSSPKQARFMRAVAHNPTFAKEVGVPQKVGKDFADADKRSPIQKVAIAYRKVR